jgi:hypothetical protein
MTVTERLWLTTANPWWRSIDGLPPLAQCKPATIVWINALDAFTESGAPLLIPPDSRTAGRGRTMAYDDGRRIP